MENMFSEIDKSFNNGYSVILKDYLRRKKEISRYSGEEFAERFIELVMVLHQLYVVTDIMYAKDLISESTYNTVMKYLESEKKWLKELLVGYMYRDIDVQTREATAIKILY